MRHARKFLCTLCLIAAALAGAPERASAQELLEQDGFINVRIAGKLVRLESYIVRMKELPAGMERLPVALITHGKPPSNGRMSDMRAKAYAMHARDFARRGYVAAVVMRRGFGRSDGPSPSPVSCESKNFADNFEANGDDLEGALNALYARPDADPGRAIAMGASAGGAAVLALAARNPRGLKGVINVSGGLKIDECPKDELLVTPIADFGGRSKIKTLWIYADNDSTFPPAIVDKMHEGYLTRGGDVRRVRVPALGSDGHTMFNTLLGRRIWLTEADSFLRDIGLPTWTQADVKNALQRLKLGPSQAAFVERYLSAPGEKALARSKTSTRTYFQFGAASMNEVRDRALNACQSRQPPEVCEIVAENHEFSGEGGKGLMYGFQ